MYPWSKIGFSHTIYANFYKPLYRYNLRKTIFYYYFTFAKGEWKKWIVIVVTKENYKKIKKIDILIKWCIIIDNLMWLCWEVIM